MSTPRVAVAQLSSHIGEEVLLRGWLYNKRSSGKLHFLEVRDGSGICQCVVFKGNVSPELFAQADHLAQETSLAVTGTVTVLAPAESTTGNVFVFTFTQVLVLATVGLALVVVG